MYRKLFVWALCAHTAGLVSAQKRTSINGRVVEAGAAGSPVPMATIRLLGVGSQPVGGTTGDAEGHFCLKMVDGAERIAVSCLGYETECVAAESVSQRDGDTLTVCLRPLATALGGVTVTGATVMTKADRRVLLPDGEQRRAATDGIDLLRRMKPVRLTVNQLTGAVGMAAGGEVLLCVNGVQVSSAELAAVRPEDVVRIEYHDNPGARYAGAGAVVDFITRRHEAGGGISGNSMSAVGSGKWASIDHFSAQCNRGRSALSVTAGYFGQRRGNWVRDYDETWHYPDREVSRREVGTPVRIGADALQAHLNYSMASAGRYLFNARLTLDHNYVPAKEEGDRRAQLHTSDSEVPIDVCEHTTERSTSPSLDLYFQHSIGNGRQVIADVVGTYIRTGGSRTYREGLADGILSEDFSDVTGDKYSLIAEAIYEQRRGGIRLSGGLRHAQAYTANRYDGTGGAALVAMRQAETSAFAEGGIGRDAWDVTGSLRTTRLHYSQGGQATERYALQPSARLTLRPSERLFVRYSAGLRTQIPSLADMSDVEQVVQPGMVRRGNPGLKPFRVLDQQLSAGVSSRLLDIDVTVGCRHEFRPIMESVLFEDGIFVRTYANQRSFRRLNAEATVTLRPWGKHLSVALTPLVYHYVSHGNDYRHTHTIGRLKVDADLTFGSWTLSYNMMMGAANTMYGEESLEEKNMNTVFVGYRQPRWTVQAGVFNAFVSEYWMKTRNENALTPFTSHAYCSRNMYFAMKLSFNISSGRQSHDRQPRITNEDKETGIMQGTK